MQMQFGRIDSKKQVHEMKFGPKNFFFNLKFLLI